MSDLSSRSIPGFKLIKGISACSVNPANLDQFR